MPIAAANSFNLAETTASGAAQRSQIRISASTSACGSNRECRARLNALSYIMGDANDVRESSTETDPFTSKKVSPQVVDNGLSLQCRAQDH